MSEIPTASIIIAVLLVDSEEKQNKKNEWRTNWIQRYNVIQQLATGTMYIKKKKKIFYTIVYAI